MPSYKHSRIAEDIRREITILIRELKDPRVKDKMLTVVRVETPGRYTLERVEPEALRVCIDKVVKEA